MEMTTRDRVFVGTMANTPRVMGLGEIMCGFGRASLPWRRISGGFDIPVALTHDV